MKKVLLPLIILNLLFVSCSENEPKEYNSVEESFISYDLKYAKGFQINKYSSHKEIIIKHPENGNFIQSFIVSDTSKITSNLSSIFSSSTTHLAYLDALDKNEFVKGFVNKNYIYNSTYLKQFETNKTIDVGNGDDLDLERIISNKPDVFFVSGLLGKSPQFEKLSQIGIPFIEVVEWAEVHPLARAEWIKFFGVLIDEEDKADSIFNQVESNYLHLLSLSSEIDSIYKPLVLTGSSFKGTWSLPGGKNYSSVLLTDAGGYYPNSKSSNTTISIPYTIESVVAEFLFADYWLMPGVKSLKELLEEDSRYSEFKAFKMKQVYEVNKRSLPSGANDYWETALVRPDILLKDLIKIFHPDLLPNYELYFYQKIE